MLSKFLHILALFLLFTSGFVYGQFEHIKENDSLLEQLMKTQPENFDYLIKSPEKYRLQIIYTQIEKKTE